jgi:hypothetical protein
MNWNCCCKSLDEAIELTRLTWDPNVWTLKPPLLNQALLAQLSDPAL